MLTADVDHHRRIFTDGCDRPRDIELTYQGYAIGRRIDAAGDGRYDVLEVKTRGFKGARSCTASGLPLHFEGCGEGTFAALHRRPALCHQRMDRGQLAKTSRRRSVIVEEQVRR